MLLVVGRVLALFIGMATTVILVRALSKAEYGAFEYALTLAGAGRILLSLGQGRLLSRFMAGYEEHRRLPPHVRSMFLAVGTICATSIPIIAALFLFSEQLLGSVVDSEAAVRLVLVLLFVAPWRRSTRSSSRCSQCSASLGRSSSASTCSPPG